MYKIAVLCKFIYFLSVKKADWYCTEHFPVQGIESTMFDL